MRAAPKPKKNIDKISVKVKGVVLSVENDPFVLSEILRTDPGAIVYSGPFSLHPLVSAALAIFPGSRIDRSVSLPSFSFSSSYGLGLSSHNFEVMKGKLWPIDWNLEDPKDILKNFRVMKSKEEAKRVVMVNKETREIVDMPTRCRWNSKGRYPQKVRRRIEMELTQHKTVRMLTLTFDMALVQSWLDAANLPVWVGVKEWLALAGSLYLQEFFDKLRAYRASQGLRWNYLGYVIEFQKNGNLHFHVLFFGSWIAPIEKLKQFWGGSKQDAGVDVSKAPSVRKRGRHKNLNHYVGKYLTKFTSDHDDPKMELVYALIWRFKVRTFNVNQGPRLKREKGLGRSEVAVCVSKWDYCSYCYHELDDDYKRLELAAYEKRKAGSSAGGEPGAFSPGVPLSEYSIDPDGEG